MCLSPVSLMSQWLRGTLPSPLLGGFIYPETSKHFTSVSGLKLPNPAGRQASSIVPISQKDALSYTGCDLQDHTHNTYSRILQTLEAPA